MRLLTVQVQDFRIVEDSGEFSVGEVTALVGKNESGKTALLKALHKLNPDAASKEQFRVASDYPRRKWRPDSTVPNEPAAITTTWELSETEMLALGQQFGSGVITSRNFKLKKTYDNVRRYDISIDEAALVRNIVAKSKLDALERKPTQSQKTVADLRAVLEATESRSPRQEALLNALKVKPWTEGGRMAVIVAVGALVPTFLYFDEYLTLPGEVSLDEMKKREEANQIGDRDRVFLALLSLAGTTLENVHRAGTFEEFNAKLRSVSNQITDQIFKYWSQNKHLDVDMKLDTARAKDPAPFNAGWVFRTRIANRRHRADTSFDDRSRGFVWFFSFLVWFYQLRQLYGSNLVILLDEPGLSLHAKAQNDLLRYINEQLRPYYQVIYTTHSPFMIDPDNILSARTVEDVVIKEKSGDETLLGTKVGEDVLSIDADTISPLQRALGYELTQTLFIGRHTLLVEGPSDFLYLRWFSQQLAALRGSDKGLDYRWTISVVRGIDRIPGFVSLYRGNNLQVAALADVQKGHGKKLDLIRQSLADKHLITVSDITGSGEADIEDMLGRDFYFALMNDAYGLRQAEELKTTESYSGDARIAAEVETRFRTMPPQVAEYDHTAPALFLFNGAEKGRSYPGFEEALQRFESLFTRVNSLLGVVKA